MATIRDGKREIKLPGFNTCEQAAAKLKLEPDTIRRYVHRGLIEAGVFGGQYVISDAELARFRRDKREPGRPRKIS